MIVLFLSLAAALAIISGRLFSLQVHQHPKLVEAANRQYRRLVPLVSRRGTIYDRNGREFAGSLRVSSIFAQPLGGEAAASLVRPGQGSGPACPTGS
jgi:cell division protein FtsI/penicillin-binding protein 2